MSDITGHALRMRVELASLMRARGVSLEPKRIPLVAPVEHTVEVSGLATTVDIDLGRQKFQGWAFSNPCLLLSNYPRPPLLYKHRDRRGSRAGKVLWCVLDRLRAAAQARRACVAAPLPWMYGEVAGSAFALPTPRRWP